MSVDSMSARPLRVTELSTASATTPAIGKLLALRTAAWAAGEAEPGPDRYREEGTQGTINDEGMLFIDSCCAHCAYRLEVRCFECIFCKTDRSPARRRTRPPIRRKAWLRDCRSGPFLSVRRNVAPGTPVEFDVRQSSNQQGFSELTDCYGCVRYTPVGRPQRPTRTVPRRRLERVRRRSPRCPEPHIRQTSIDGIHQGFPARVSNIEAPTYSRTVAPRTPTCGRTSGRRISHMAHPRPGLRIDRILTLPRRSVCSYFCI
jgi:hypothetical protein